MGLLGALLGLVVISHVLRHIDHDEHQRLHRHGIHHHHHDRNLRHSKPQMDEHLEIRRKEGYRGRFGTRKDGRAYRKR